MNLFITILCLSGAALGQLEAPSPPYVPPGASSGASPSQTLAVPNAQWSNLLGNVIFFYDAQRSGKLPSSNRVSWRNDSALDDGADVNLDLSGGYYDAGDYIKATFPLSFTLTSICWGAMEYGQGYDVTNQTAYLDSTLRWGLDWLMKAHPSNSTLYVLVGDSQTDNDYWGGDLGIPNPRASFQINDTSPGTDAAAAASAAFSACSALYGGIGFNTSASGPATLQSINYAETLLEHAQQLYSFAVNAQGGQKKYQDSVPEVNDAYGSSSFEDELTMAALFLALVSNSSSLYTDAENYYSEFSLGGGRGAYNWDSKTPALAVLFAKVASFYPSIGGNLDKWQSEAEDYFDNILDKGEKTEGGLLWYDGVSDLASLNPALNAALLLSLYAPLATSSSKRVDYLSYANDQLNYVLGDNPMSVPYIVGSNPNSPQNPHSAMASGGNDIGDINNSPPQEAYVLYGSVVGGPDKQDRYFDLRNDWPQTEPALDYNAPILSLVALRAMNDSNDPFFTKLQAGAYDAVRPEGTPCDPVYPCHTRSRLSTGGKIAIAVIVSVVGLLVIGGIVYWLRLESTRGKRA